MTLHEQLKARVCELGMSLSALSQRSGVPIATVKRALNRGIDNVAFGTVEAIAQALGMSLDLNARTTGYQYCQQQARRRARQITGLVQGTSALEAQAVGQHDLDQMTERTARELQFGRAGRLWT